MWIKYKWESSLSRFLANTEPQQQPDTSFVAQGKVAATDRFDI